MVASERGENYEKVEHALRDTELTHVFYLDGGMEAYRKHLKLQAAMWHRIPGKQGEDPDLRGIGIGSRDAN